MTLTEAAHWTKRLVWFALAGFILFIVLVMVILNKTKPQQLPQYMYPDFACTNTAEEFLKYQLDIPTINYTLETSDNTFTLDTQTGRIDQLPEIINVYRYDNPEQILTAQNDARKLAEKLAFEGQMQRLGTTYKWADSYGRTLTIQARNFVFDLKFDFSRPSARPQGDLPTKDQAIQAARDFLSDASLLNRHDYAKGVPKELNITITQNGSFKQGKSVQESNLVRVDFMREASMITIPSNVEGAEDIRKMLEKKGHNSVSEDTTTTQGKATLYKFNTAITTLDPFKSNISMYIGAKHPELKGRGVNQIYGIEYTNWIIEPEHCGTYKLVNPAQVLTYVQNGQASLVYLNEKDGDLVLQDGSKNVRNFTLRDIQIWYYDAPHEQEFLQPVYAVTGEATFTSGRVGEFIFYYPAIDYEFIENSQVTQQESL